MYSFRYSILQSCWQTEPHNRKTFTDLCSVMETQLHMMSDYLDLNVIENTEFNNAAVPMTSEGVTSLQAVEEVSVETSEGTTPLQVGEVPNDDEGVYHKASEATLHASADSHVKVGKQVSEEFTYVSL